MIWHYYVCSCSTAAWGRSTVLAALEVVAAVHHSGLGHELTWGVE